MPNNWQTVLDEIQSSVSDMAFKTYFTNIKYISDENGVVSFSVPNSFVKSSIEKKYHDKVISALQAAGFDCIDFEIVIDDSGKNTGEQIKLELPLCHQKVPGNNSESP